MITWIKQHQLQLFAIAFWVVLVIAGFSYIRVNDLTLNEVASQLQTLFTETPYGALLFIGIYLLRPLILFPASWLTLLGGNVFGLIPGFLLVLFAGTLSAITPYLVGRWFAPESIRTDNPLARFTTLIQNNPFQAVLIPRLLGFPYDVVSLGAGSLRIPIGVFFLATLLGNVIGSFVYVGIGASLQGDITTGEIQVDPAVLAVSIAAAGVSLALSRLLKRRESSDA
ncbi:MAG: VTT domain-containing protein [Anaerolineae bacterium]|jgi:uncharacterized membrane protein YdjX (TVP38/TMEM64 family)|nr:VTT domain-containing protein [Anaerolineae bacterium]